jgi:hypothetical protein
MPISHLVDLTLHIVLLTITQAIESTRPTFASRRQLYYVVMSLSPTLYNWCVVVLETMKEQLTKCSFVRQNKFVYGSILLSFFFDQVPSSRIVRKKSTEIQKKDASKLDNLS